MSSSRWSSVAPLAATALIVASLTVAAPVARAASTQVDSVDTSQPAAAFGAGKHVWVASGSSKLLDSSDAAKIEAALAGSTVYLSVVEEPALGRAQTKPVSDAIAAAAGSKGSYVLLGVAAGVGGTYLQISSPVEASVYGPQLREAINQHHGQPAAQALQLTTALAGDKPPAAKSSTGTVVVVVIVVAALLLLVLVVWRRQRSRRQALRRRLDDARVEAESLADDLLITDPAGRVALRDDDASPQERALKVAWSRLQAAQAMLSGTADRADIDRARALTAQGRAALDHAQRLRDGVPDEAEVLRLARAGGGPDPTQRYDQAQSAPPVRQQLLSQWTAATYPGYGYGWYPGFGYGFYDYGGSFVTGLLAGELLSDAFSPWGGYGGFGGYGGYDVGYGSGYDTGYDAGVQQGQDPGVDPSGGDPSYGQDGSYDTGSYDSGSYDAGSFDSGSFDGGGDQSYGGDSGGGGDW
ncbi:hypothetical protein acdb102_35380 [Acidothermaceae bacterium B102]|nr:hypothetical protein acdb102_35380 [Acidothermaceae bacterium B102]